MGKSVAKKDVGNYRIKIYPDTDPSDPRGDDNMGTMICFYNRYTLGDNHNFKAEHYDGWDEMEKAIKREFKGGVILPLYMLDHSGLTISTSSFNDPWDSGRVGFIVASGKDIRENWNIKSVTKKWTDKARELLLAEVEEYDQYLTGDVYGYRIFNIKKNGKKGDEVDSSWGYYGRDNCMSEAVSLAEGFTIADEVGVESV
jgi:hypothetical protein